MSNNRYLAHHGVKGQKWGVRKQQPTSNRIRSSSPSTKPSPDRRKAIAIAAVSAIGAASLIGGGVAIAKNPKAVTNALFQIGGAFVRAPKTKMVSKAKAVAKNTSFGLIQSRLQNKKPSGPLKKAFRGAKRVFGNTSKGVLGGLTGAAREMATEDYVRGVVQKGLTKGVETVGIAAITGGLALGVKTAVSGTKPTRKEFASYMTKNPNKKGK